MTALLVIPGLLLILSLLHGECTAAPTISPVQGGYAKVQLDAGTFWGITNETFTRFLGIPFAQPPVGDLRFRLPLPNDPYDGDYPATFFGNSCPQQAPPLSIPVGFENITDLFVSSFVGTQAGPGVEDCLTVNVWAPYNISNTSALPVLAWIYGGGFEDGGSSLYDPTTIIARSIEMEQPIIFLSMNYRLTGLGFLASEEVLQASVANLGLQDQRLALRWVQKYIPAFGGDPTKVTIWGQSSGAESVGLQMLAKGGDNEGLFRSAVMESGPPPPVGNITHGQRYYDDLVVGTNCTNTSDTLQCLREAPYKLLKKAIDATPSLLSYQSQNLAWPPRADGIFLVDNPLSQLMERKVANIPFIVGDVDDEGTIFALDSLNITTDAEVHEYITNNYFPGAASEDIDMLLQLYPQDPTQGSPYDTGLNNTLTPEYKRMASFQGDFIFQAPRRFMLQQLSTNQSAWTYLVKKGKDNYPRGAYHGSELPDFFSGDMTDYLINFVNHLDPNGPDTVTWPKYTPSSPQLLTLTDGPTPFIITDDTYREGPMAFVSNLSLKYPL